MSNTKVKIGKHGRNAGWWRLRDAIADGSEFTNANGSFRGERRAVGAYPTHTGRMPAAMLATWANSLELIDYVVYSYGTPIAWHTRAAVGSDATWWVPRTTYSVTTSQHQGKIHVAVAEQPSASAYPGKVIEF